VFMFDHSSHQNLPLIFLGPLTFFRPMGPLKIRLLRELWISRHVSGINI
jgi:hypothetical protein